MMTINLSNQKSECSFSSECSSDPLVNNAFDTEVTKNDRTDVLIWYNTANVIFIAILLFYNKYNIDSMIKNNVSPKTLVFNLVSKAVFGGLYMLFLLPQFIPMFIIGFLIRSFVMAIIRFRYGSSVSHPFGMDAMWGYKSPYSRPFIFFGNKIEGELSIERIKKKFKKVILDSHLPDGSLIFRKLTQSFESWLGYYIWKDMKHFDVGNHIRHVKLDEIYNARSSEGSSSRSETMCSESLLCQYLADYGNKDFKTKGSMWEVDVLTYNDEKSYFLLVKLHHAVADGISFMRFVSEILTDTPITGLNLLDQNESKYERMFKTLWSIALFPFATFKVTLSRNYNPLHGKQLTGKKIYKVSKSFPMAMVKEIKKRLNVTFIDVVFSCLSYALSCHFQRKDSEIPSINMVFPMGFEDSNAPPTLTNYYNMGISDLPTFSDKYLKDCKTNSKDTLLIRRVFEVKKKLDEEKMEPGPLSLYYATQSSCILLPAFIIEMMLSPGGKTIGVSNLPGPPKSISLFGNTVTDLMFWVPDRSPSGVGFGIISYNGNLRMTMNVDEALVDNESEVEDMVNNFFFSLNQLKADTEERK